MTISERISRQLAMLRLVPINESKYLRHLHADYVELLALFSNGDLITATHFISRLVGEGFEIMGDADIGTGEEIGSLNVQRSDSNEAWGVEVFSLIAERENIFGEKYPFNVVDQKIALRNELEPIHKIYLMLLLSSSLRHFPMLEPRLTSEFESISFFALKEYLPNHAEVKQFGKQSHYNGSAIQKIKTLAGDMGLEINEKELAHIPPQNSQEEGLDLVGWIPFSDKIPSMVSLFGQCACGKGWASKQNETRRYEEFFIFYKVPPIHMLFIPYAIGQQDRQFSQSKDINKGLLVFDRKRILDLLKDTTIFDTMDSKEIVNKCIEYVEDIV